MYVRFATTKETNTTTVTSAKVDNYQVVFSVKYNKIAI